MLALPLRGVRAGRHQSGDVLPAGRAVDRVAPRPWPGSAGGGAVGGLCFFFLCPAASVVFAVSDVEYLITFAVMLIVGLVASWWRAGSTAQRARQREAHTRLLCEMARRLGSALLPETSSRHQRARLAGGAGRRHPPVAARRQRHTQPGCPGVVGRRRHCPLVPTTAKPPGQNTHTCQRPTCLYLPRRRPYAPAA